MKKPKLPSSAGIPKRPSVADGDHPIESTRYILETPAATSLYSTVDQWVRNRVPGGIVYGRPRRGKSKAVELLEEEFRQRFPGMPVVVLPAFDHDIPKEEAFLERLLSEAGHAFVTAGSLDAKIHRLAEFLAQSAEQSRQGRAVIIIDEAQTLGERHYKTLISIHNQLDRRRVNLIVILVGQHQLLDIRASYIAAEKHQIVGRFMIQVMEFHGIRNVAELESCLQGYDENSEYPVGSGWSFTRYYLTAWFDAGGRLKRLANDFWAVLVQERKNGKNQADKELTMQDLARSVEHFLRIADRSNEKTKQPMYDLTRSEDVREAFRKALADSGYLNALKLDWDSRDEG